MTSTTEKCPICGTQATINRLPQYSDSYDVQCLRCKRFLIDGMDKWVFENPDAQVAKLLPGLSAYVRQANERGEYVKLDENWKEYALARKNTSILKKATKLLELLAARAQPGTSAKLDSTNDPPLVDAWSAHELTLLIRYLRDAGYIEGERGHYRLTVKAWERVESAAATGSPGNCFVAMSFDKSLKEAYDAGIYLAVKQDCNMDPIRIDLVEHNDKICDRIIAAIRACQFLIADVTLQRAGVYFGDLRWDSGDRLFGHAGRTIWRTSISTPDSTTI